MNTTNTFFAFLLPSLVVLFCMTATGGSHDGLISDNTTYTLPACPVSGQPLGAMGAPVIEIIDDREVRFCCAGCVGKYRANTADYEAKVNAAVIEQQKEAYPLDRCLVMDIALKDMGNPIEYVYRNRLVRFCCASCIDSFESDPAAYLEKVDAALVENALADHSPEDVCVVSGEPLGKKPVALVIAN